MAAIFIISLICSHSQCCRHHRQSAVLSDASSDVQTTCRTSENGLHFMFDLEILELCDEKYEIVSVVVICTNILSRVIRLSTKVPIDRCPDSIIN